MGGLAYLSACKRKETKEFRNLETEFLFELGYPLLNSLIRQIGLVLLVNE